MGALDGRVAIITGAGRGIGREHALLFAREGAAVVVNDVGGSNAGEGTDAGPANAVVEEIAAAGGTAVANMNSVADWDGANDLVHQAINEFGRLDVVVNNAGILRDSYIATIPNPGQSNYGSAKAGIAALTLIAAEELQRYGVRVNAIAPIARTRLTLATPGMGTLMAEPEQGEFDLFSPANITPLVAYLATEKCPITGKVYAVQGGAISELSGWSDVSTIETDRPWTIDDIAARLGR